MSTLIIENVKDEFLPAFRAISKAMDAKCKVQKPKLTKFEKEILKARAEVEKERKDGTLRTFESAREFRMAVENGEI
ncbi:hypothetical protein ACWIUD_06410 [Helicobacter sp. 23-1044]